MANIDLPVADTEIMAEWGQSVAKAVNGIQTGTVLIAFANSANSAEIRVNYAKPYAVAPVTVACSAGGSSMDTVVSVVASDLTGFTIKGRASGTLNANRYANWIAFGDIA
jgi:hypothetical protein